jgi:acetyltransferase-like isoleucine patch superfamily enzyme
LRRIKIGKGVKIYPKVKIGEGSIISDYVILGFPPKQGEKELIIGKQAFLRPFTVIYGGTIIGDNFQTGQGTIIREKNKIGNKVSVGTHTILEVENIIEEGVRIHSNCFLELTTLKEYVFVGPGTTFLDNLHPMNCPYWKKCTRGAIVEKYAKIGGGVTILPGVKIGENALIGGGSCVVKDVPPQSVVVGNPAKEIKKLASLKCHKNWFEKPYMWKPYTTKK